MDLKTFNKQPRPDAVAMLATACGASHWIDLVMQQFPFSSEEELLAVATEVWYHQCTEKDWKEAFTHHPKIGDVEQLEQKFASTKDLAGKEQSGVSKEDHAVIEKLLKGNQEYEKKFGFIFIVYATGKTGSEMLALLNDRLSNNEEDELAIAMGEQHKITVTRLRKILSESNWNRIPGSQLTTHVLDTSIGKPGKNIKVNLFRKVHDAWKTITVGRTNADGRITDLLPPGKIMDQGEYKIIFDTASYFDSLQLKSFYPLVEIQFIISGSEHYHIPLLLNPYGYSTYRGS
jgi:5-hydroxyisourate hydrolase / 2-oxo-4-hydroxy-4-carboxy-5-ureidoimidazoline decarboxylase